MERLNITHGSNLPSKLFSLTLNKWAEPQMGLVHKAPLLRRLAPLLRNAPKFMDQLYIYLDNYITINRCFATPHLPQCFLNEPQHVDMFYFSLWSLLLQCQYINHPETNMVAQLCKPVEDKATKTIAQYNFVPTVLTWGQKSTEITFYVDPTY